MTTPSRSSAPRRLKLVLIAACLAAVSISAFPASSQADLPLISFCVILDTCGPSITSGPAEGSAQFANSASFAFTRDNTFDFQCSFDGGVTAACTSPVSYTSLSQGPHTFNVYARKLVLTHVCLGLGGTPPCIDFPSAGDSTNTTTRHFTVDRTNPVASFTSGPAEGSTITVDNATFGFTASDATAVTYTCKVDAAAAGDCSSPFGITGLAAGAHKLVVTPTDAANNVGASITRNFTYTPPVVSGTGNAAPTPKPSAKHCTKYKKVRYKKNGHYVKTHSGKFKLKKKCVKLSS